MSTEYKENLNDILQFAAENGKALRDAFGDNEDFREMKGCHHDSPCCCPFIVKIKIFAVKANVYNAACPEIDDVAVD